MRTSVVRSIVWRVRVLVLAGLVGLVALPVVASAQQASATPQPSPDQQRELAKKLFNPVSDLVSVPFQFNWEQNVGPAAQTRFVLNVQPVMPFAVSEKWNMIARVIMPLVSQPPLVEGGSATFGISDVFASFWFSPKRG